VKAIASAVTACASASTPSASGWSAASSATTWSSWRPGASPLAGVGEHRAQPVALGVGLLLEPAEVDLRRLAGAEQQVEVGGAERGVRVAVAGAGLDVLDQAGVGGQGLLGQRVGRVEVGGQAPHHRQQRLGDRSAHPVQRADGGVDGPGPGGQMPPASLGALLRRGVVAVVAGEVEPADVVQRVASVQFELAELDPHGVLVGGDVGVVEWILQGWAAEPGEPGSDPLQGEVLDTAVVVVVQADVLAYRRDGQVTEGVKALVHCGSLGRGHAGDNPVLPDCG